MRLHLDLPVGEELDHDGAQQRIVGLADLDECGRLEPRFAGRRAPPAMMPESAGRS
jgi:hypothetical protein